MSAIIAGKSCKICNKEYYISFGHPKWFDDVLKRGKEPCKEFKKFCNIQESGMCLYCYTKEKEKTNESID